MANPYIYSSASGFSHSCLSERTEQHMMIDQELSPFDLN